MSHNEEPQATLDFGGESSPSDEQASIIQEMDRTDEKATGILKRLADDLWEQRKSDTALHAFLGT